jgi:hypothetical protein
VEAQAVVERLLPGKAEERDHAMGKQSKKRRAPAVEPPRTEVRGQPAASASHPRSPLPATSPGAIGSYLGMGIGFGLLVLGVLGQLRSDPLPFALVLAMCLFGALECVVSWLTIRRQRVAWSFAVSLSGTMALACLFGAPKIRDAMDVGIGLAVMPSLLAAVTTVLLAMAADAISARS